MNIQLGVLEEMVLLILLVKDETYGLDIAKEYEEQFEQSISLPAIHVVLKRLEKKGLVQSRLGEPTAERGGRRKRMYRATSKGFEAAKYLQQKRAQLWKAIPNLNINLI